MRLLNRLVPVVILAVIIAAARAQDPAKDAKPALNADTFKLPASAYDPGKFNYDPPKADAGGFAPGRVDLGSSVLQFDTKEKGPGNRVGIETVDPSLLGGIRKDEPTLPHYFGMTLSKPLN
jgi:hypothetical protein